MDTMYRRFVFLALSVLLAYAPIDALAGQGSGSQSQNAHLRPHHAISPRHHATSSDDSRESYRSQRLRAKSEWRQALHRENTSVPFRTAAQ
jgi:hypothetical protein